MANSLRSKLSKLRYKKQISDEEYRELTAKLDGHDKELLAKIRAEVDRQEKWLLQAGCTAYNVDIAFDAIKAVVAERSGEEWEKY